MFTDLMIGSAFFWILTYVLIIKRGFKDKTFGMPLIALCFNISWEFIYMLIYPHPTPYIYSNILAFSLDIVILYQLLTSWQKEYSNLPKQHFYPSFIIILATCFSIIYLIPYIYDDQIGFYIAFAQNLLMSILFVIMLRNRNNLRGQSIYIAIFKLIGTVLASLAFHQFDPINKRSTFLEILYITIIFFDLLYVMNIYKKSIEENIKIWTRF